MSKTEGCNCGRHQYPWKEPLGFCSKYKGKTRHYDNGRRIKK